VGDEEIRAQARDDRNSASFGCLARKTECGLHRPPKVLDGLPSLGSEAGQGEGLLTHEPLFHLHITRLFEFAHVGGQIAPCELARLEQKDEVGFLDRRQDEGDHQPGGPMHDAIHIGQLVQPLGRRL